MPHVDDYRFGRIVIDGDTYTNDVIVFPDHVHGDWWRDEGHVLKPEDLGQVVDADPDTLIVGTGHDGRMAVPDRTRAFLAEHGIDATVTETGSAVDAFNAADDAVAALHLTC